LSGITVRMSCSSTASWKSYRSTSASPWHGTPTRRCLFLLDPGFTPSLVVTDLHMPKRGIDELLKCCEVKHVPVVVFSSALNPAELDQVMKLGAKEYVEKPVGWDDLRDAVAGISSKWATHP
jgi:DNA-binding NtrC family response regulator